MPDTITKTTANEVLFISSKPELRLVRRGSVSQYGSVGQYAGEVPGSRVVYDFEDHQLRARPGEDVLADGPPDETGALTEQDKVQWLRGHPAFNGNEANGFHEHGNEPNRVPDPGPALDAITNLAIYGNVDGIRELMQVERDTHDRAIVLERAQAALDSVEAALAENPVDGPENG